jgi:hypothetical protein
MAVKPRREGSSPKRAADAWAGAGLLVPEVRRAPPGARHAARFTNLSISGRRLSTRSGRWLPRFSTRRCTPSSP